MAPFQILELEKQYRQREQIMQDMCNRTIEQANLVLAAVGSMPEQVQNTFHAEIAKAQQKMQQMILLQTMEK